MINKYRNFCMHEGGHEGGAAPEDCTHDCSTCGADCASRDGGIQKAELNPYSSVKKVIAVVSGKGGVGKSMVTALSAIAATRTLSPTPADDEDRAKLYAKFRIVLSFIMGITLSILICF